MSSQFKVILIGIKLVRVIYHLFLVPTIIPLLSTAPRKHNGVVRVKRPCFPSTLITYFWRPLKWQFFQGTTVSQPYEKKTQQNICIERIKWKVKVESLTEGFNILFRKNKMKSESGIAATAYSQYLLLHTFTNNHRKKGLIVNYY